MAIHVQDVAAALATRYAAVILPRYSKPTFCMISDQLVQTGQSPGYRMKET